MKTKLLVPAMYAREMIDGPDLDRYLASGSYLIGTRPKKPTDHAIAQRAFKQRRSEAGFKRLDVLLDEQIYNALMARRRDGESLAAIIKRLLNLPDDNDQTSMVGADN